MWPHNDCRRGNEFQKSTLNVLINLTFSHFAPQVNETENKLAMEMSKVDNRSLSEFEIFHEKLETILHPQHYLMIMLKRHLVQLYSGVLAQLDDEDLERVALQSFHSPTSQRLFNSKTFSLPGKEIRRGRSTGLRHHRPRLPEGAWHHPWLSL